MSRTGIHGGIRRGGYAAAIGAVLVLATGATASQADEGLADPGSPTIPLAQETGSLPTEPSRDNPGGGLQAAPGQDREEPGSKGTGASIRETAGPVASASAPALLLSLPPALFPAVTATLSPTAAAVPTPTPSASPAPTGSTPAPAASTGTAPAPAQTTYGAASQTGAAPSPAAAATTAVPTAPAVTAPASAGAPAAADASQTPADSGAAASGESSEVPAAERPLSTTPAASPAAAAPAESQAGGAPLYSAYQAHPAWTPYSTGTGLRSSATLNSQPEPRSAMVWLGSGLVGVAGAAGLVLFRLRNL
ncbi:hypothetical protein ACJJV6_00980 [Arthrobacter nitrophenolicus]|uniref:hypothetical protein n=1 Tax=Arthrobacter nitrophenolicus TaxID=683150 RepID=UPI0034836E3A